MATLLLIHPHIQVECSCHCLVTSPLLPKCILFNLGVYMHHLLISTNVLELVNCIGTAPYASRSELYVGFIFFFFKSFIVSNFCEIATVKGNTVLLVGFSHFCFLTHWQQSVSLSINFYSVTVNYTKEIQEVP